MPNMHLVYIDLDSGTVLNGPVYAVEVSITEMDDVLDNDETAREYARVYGRRLLP